MIPRSESLMIQTEVRSARIGPALSPTGTWTLRYRSLWQATWSGTSCSAHSCFGFASFAALGQLGLSARSRPGLAAMTAAAGRAADRRTNSACVLFRGIVPDPIAQDCERWPSRLVATAEEDRLSFRRKSARFAGTPPGGA